MKRRDWLKASAALIGSMAAVPWGWAQPGGANPTREGIRRQLRFTVLLSNPMSHELRNQTL